MAVVSTGFAQGTINWANANNSKISVNTTVGGAPTALMVANAGTLATTYYFALFYSTTASLVGGSSSAILGSTGATYAFNDSSWNFLSPAPIGGYVVGPAYGTNGVAGRYTPENGDTAHGNAVITANTTPASFVVIGWSANIGSTVAALENWYSAPSVNGWIGESPVSALTTPGDPTTTPPGTTPAVFSTAMTFSLGEVAAVPEPTTMALFGLGGLALLAFRRRQ